MTNLTRRNLLHLISGFGAAAILPARLLARAARSGPEWVRSAVDALRVEIESIDSLSATLDMQVLGNTDAPDLLNGESILDWRKHGYTLRHKRGQLLIVETYQAGMLEKTVYINNVVEPRASAPFDAAMGKTPSDILWHLAPCPEATTMRVADATPVAQHSLGEVLQNGRVYVLSREDGRVVLIKEATNSRARTRTERSYEYPGPVTPIAQRITTTVYDDRGRILKSTVMRVQDLTVNGRPVVAVHHAR